MGIRRSRQRLHQLVLLLDRRQCSPGHAKQPEGLRHASIITSYFSRSFPAKFFRRLRHTGQRGRVGVRLARALLSRPRTRPNRPRHRRCPRHSRGITQVSPPLLFDALPYSHLHSPQPAARSCSTFAQPTGRPQFPLNAAGRPPSVHPQHAPVHLPPQVHRLPLRRRPSPPHRISHPPAAACSPAPPPPPFSFIVASMVITRLPPHPPILRQHTNAPRLLQTPLHQTQPRSRNHRLSRRQPLSLLVFLQLWRGWPLCRTSVRTAGTTLHKLE